MKKLLFLTMYLGLTCTITPVEAQELPAKMPHFEKRKHCPRKCSDSSSHRNSDQIRCPRGAAGPKGATGPTGPTGARGTTGIPGATGATGLLAISDAWAYSLLTGPTGSTGGYLFVDTGGTTGHEFILLEHHHPSADVIFTDLNAATPPFDTGTMVTFLNAGTYFIEFSVVGVAPPNGNITPFRTYDYLIGVFEGTGGNPPNTLSNGNLFECLTELGNGKDTLTDFLTLQVLANDTIALGNATKPTANNPAVLGPLFLDQHTYVPASGPTAISTTAAINIIRIN